MKLTKKRVIAYKYDPSVITSKTKLISIGMVNAKAFSFRENFRVNPFELYAINSKPAFINEFTYRMSHKFFCFHYFNTEIKFLSLPVHTSFLIANSETDGVVNKRAICPYYNHERYIF